MTLISLLIFMLPVLTGGLIVHLLWPERQENGLLLKLSLGAGLGLGLNSILYFAALHIAPARLNGPVLQATLLLLAAAAALRWRRRPTSPGWPTWSRLQWVLLGVTLAAVVFSGLVFVNLTIARPQGAYDAWSIWNRAARFIHRDPENWRATVSPELYWGAHADYPLMIPLNVAWGWTVAGEETQRVPMMQAALFLFATIGLMFAALQYTRSPGQASLAALVLMSTPTVLLTGYGLIADLPLTYFILAACVLLYIYFCSRSAAWLLLAGICAGLGAWTKNEGLLFVTVSLVVLAWACRREGVRPLGGYLAGLSVPMLVVLYFKLALAPSNDLFGRDLASMLTSIADLARYWTILKALYAQVLGFGGWPIGIFILLAIYALLVRLNVTEGARPARWPAAMLALQFLGYLAIYVVTPHDLEWHLGTALERLILHVYPAAVFLFFCAVREPEAVFAPRTAPQE